LQIRSKQSFQYRLSIGTRRQTGARGVHGHNIANQQRFTQNYAHECSVAVLWLRVLLLHTRMQSMASRLSQQKSEQY